MSEATFLTIVEMFKLHQLIHRFEERLKASNTMTLFATRPVQKFDIVVQPIWPLNGTPLMLSAVLETRRKLFRFNSVPVNGLLSYFGTFMITDDNERDFSILYEPLRPVVDILLVHNGNTCINLLSPMLEDNNKFGFIIVNRIEALFCTLRGTTRVILERKNIKLAQSWSVLRLTALQCFYTNGRANVKGIVLALHEDLYNIVDKNKIRYQVKEIIKIVKISRHGNLGFLDAIKLSADEPVMDRTRFFQEAKLMKQFRKMFHKNPRRFCIGVDDTIEALEMGAVLKLIVSERATVFHNGNVKLFMEFLAEKYQGFVEFDLEIVSDDTPEGKKFFQQFTGIAGELKYNVNFKDDILLKPGYFWHPD